MIDTNLVIRDLVMNVFEQVIVSYRAIVSQSSEEQDSCIRLTQNQSLQMLFDLRFLYGLFDMKSFVVSAERERLSRIQNDYKQLNCDLESLVDPFDYDICSPFIQSNITKSIGRTAVTLFFIWFGIHGKFIFSLRLVRLIDWSNLRYF